MFHPRLLCCKIAAFSLILKRGYSFIIAFGLGAMFTWTFLRGYGNCIASPCRNTCRFFYDALAANHVQRRWICNFVRDVCRSETIKTQSAREDERERERRGREREREGGRDRELSSSPPREVSEVGITFGSDRRELPRISCRRAAQPVNNYPCWRVPQPRTTLCIVTRWPETTSTMHLAGEWASHISLTTQMNANRNRRASRFTMKYFYFKFYFLRSLSFFFLINATWKISKSMSSALFYSYLARDRELFSVPKRYLHFSRGLSRYAATIRRGTEILVEARGSRIPDK